MRILKKIFHYHTDEKGINIFKCDKYNIQFMNPQYSDSHLKSYYESYFNIPEKHQENIDLTHRLEQYLKLILF